MPGIEAGEIQTLQGAVAREHKSHVLAFRRVKVRYIQTAQPVAEREHAFHVSRHWTYRNRKRRGFRAGSSW